MPKAGFKNVRISGQEYDYASERKAELNEGYVSISWGDIISTGATEIENDPSMMDSMAEDHDFETDTTDKNFPISEDVYEHAVSVRNSIPELEKWDTFVDVGINTLYERHVLNGEDTSSESTGPARSEEDLRSLIRDEIGTGGLVDEMIRETINEMVVDEARQ